MVKHSKLPLRVLLPDESLQHAQAFLQSSLVGILFTDVELLLEDLKLIVFAPIQILHIVQSGFEVKWR